jgi:hypothetical protein
MSNVLNLQKLALDPKVQSVAPSCLSWQSCTSNSSGKSEGQS